MGLVGKAWRGEQQLGIVFWGYYIGFWFAFSLANLLIILALPQDLTPFVLPVTQVLYVLFWFVYLVWIAVSIWRCGKNAKPIWRVLARVWFVLAILGWIGLATALGV